MSDSIRRCFYALFVAVLWAAGAGSVFAADPDNVGSTLAGCKLGTGETLPNGSGQFVCADNEYTTGNLGKSWNELDLVPYRLTLQAKTAAPATQTYTVAVVVDNENAGAPGYDFLQTLTKNALLSDASCPAPSVGPQAIADPGIGGTGKSLYRLVTITNQAKNTTCVYDFYARLALGSHLFPGSALHANMALPTLTGGVDCSGIGCSDVSIPVKEISPQSLAKDMTAQQGADHTWNVTKSPTTYDLGFGDVCRADAPTSLPISITVNWTKSPAILGVITVTTNVYATNPSARVITTTMTDVIYSGTTALDTSSPVTKDVPANTTNFLMLTHTITVPADTTSLNDIATASYVDNVTGIPIPGTTTAKASAAVQQTGQELNATAVINDLESMTGAGLTFSLPAPSKGTFLGYPTLSDSAYVAGTPTTGPVSWGVTGETGDGSVTFNKTVYLNGKQITAGVLTDAASLVGSSGYAATSGPVTINISSTATEKLTINKSYSGLTLAVGEKLVFNFHVTRSSDGGTVADPTITFIGGGPTTGGAATISGLAPDTYVVDEKDAVFYPIGCSDSSCAFVVPMQDATSTQRTSNLQAVNGIVPCAGSVTFTNTPVRTAFPKAAVQKITNPASATGNWTFTLRKPDGTTLASKVAAANAGYVDFGVLLSEEGTYTVVEAVPVTGWDLTSAVPNNGTDTKICSFTVNFPQDLQNKTFQCTFTNTQRGKAQVLKTEKGGAPTQAFTFQLREGATTTAIGTIDETLATSPGNGTLNFTTYLVPGSTYQICEIVMPGWTTTLGTFVPGSFNPPDGLAPNPTVDNSILCANFTVAAGETKTFTIDNSPPPGGRALTIGFWKNWASCTKSSSNKKPMLDQTMAKAEPTGIQVDSFYLHGSTATPSVAPDCAKAVNLLSKNNFAGVNKSSDPLFNMAAQLVAAELNLTAGAYTCPKVATAINQANALLTQYSFNGTGYTGKLSAANATLANSLATRLDNYNNDRPAACQ